MTITKALAGDAGGYPILNLEIDGHAAYVLEPKLTLLAAGIVVLLDDAGYWETATEAAYQDDPESGPVRLAGGSTDPQLVKLVERFVNGEMGDLLAA